MTVVFAVAAALLLNAALSFSLVPGLDVLLFVGLGALVSKRRALYLALGAVFTLGVVHHAAMAPCSATATGAALSTTSGPGPMRHQTAGMRVSRKIGSLIPVAVNARSSTDEMPAAQRVARARPPADSNPVVAK